MKKYPNSGFVNKFYSFKLPLLPGFQWNLLRLCFRTAYVISTTALAMLFPYFNQVLGLLGALNFWPLAIYFPVEMYFVQKKIGAWTRKWIVLRVFSFVCFLVTVVGFIGSLEGLISAKLSWGIHGIHNLALVRKKVCNAYYHTSTVLNPFLFANASLIFSSQFWILNLS